MYTQPYYQQPKRGFPWVPVLIALGAVVIVGMLCLGGFVWYVMQEPEGIHVEVFCDNRVAVGETLPVEIYVKNTSSNSQKVESIDIENALLEGLSVIRADPPWHVIEPVPFIGRSYVYKRRLEPNEETTFVFYLKADKLGRFVGIVDVYVGIGLQSVAYELDITVMTGEEAAKLVPPKE
jgi:hypothetical protein